MLDYPTVGWALRASHEQDRLSIDDAVLNQMKDLLVLQSGETSLWYVMLEGRTDVTEAREAKLARVRSTERRYIVLRMPRRMESGLTSTHFLPSCCGILPSHTYKDSWLPRP